MKRLAGPGGGLVLSLVVILLFAVLLGVSLHRMVRVSNDIRVDAEQNMLWVMHQSESAARRLSEVALRAELGEAGADELALRLDLLRSRFALLQGGPQNRFLEDIGLADEVASQHKTLRSLEVPDGALTPAAARALRDVLAPFPAFFARAANTTMIREWDDLGGRLESSRQQLRQIITFLLGILVTGTLLVLTLFFALRLSRQRTDLLRRERDFSGLLVSSSGEGILATDVNGRCSIWNSAMSDLTGRAAENAVGRTLPEVSEFFATPPVRKALDTALGGRDATLTLLPWPPADGHPPRHVDLRMYPMRDAGQVVGAIGFLQDASDRHLARQKAAQMRADLERLVDKRTQELDAALTRERSAANLYRSFAQMISHQFRTPLAVADSALQRLIRRGARAEPAEVVERASTARDALAGLTRLLSSTLDASRVQAGQANTRAGTCDLRTVLDVVRRRRLAATPAARIEIEGPTDGAVRAAGDPAHVEQVLDNLLSNAVKYAPQGSPVTARIAAGDAEVICDISNAGPAPAPEDRPRLFEPNFRGGNSTGTPGTGIGLFIARSLARMQGGDVALRDAGEVTTFRLTLPRAPRSEKEVRP